MPKNKGKGGKNRKRGKNENEEEKRELVYKEDGQEYGQVVCMLGNGRLDCQVRIPSGHKATSSSPICRCCMHAWCDCRCCMHACMVHHACSPLMSQDSLLPCINPMQCIDGKKRMCHIRGKMRKKVWVGQGDIVLVGLRDYQDEKADVILKYSADEARVLKQYGELPAHLRINDTDVVLEGEDNENAGAVLKLCFFTLCLLHVLCPIQHIQQCA